MMKALHLMRNALLTVALTLGAAGCANHEMPDAGSLLPADNTGRKMTIHASTGQEAGTRVAYDDTQVGPTPNQALTWQAGDQLTVVGMAGGSYVDHKNDYVYKGEPGETSGDFEGTEITGADSWSVYYPNTVAIDPTTGRATLSMEGQTQTAHNNTDHLSKYLLLAATDVKDISHFGLKMQNSIMKFEINLVPSYIGKLRKLIWEVETEEGVKSITLECTGKDFDYPAPKALTAYIAFDPSVMKVKSEGKFNVKLMGDIHYQASTVISGGKTYEPGKRYTATIDGNSILWEELPCTIKLKVVPNDARFNIPFPSDGTATTPAHITVKWGDKTVTRVPKGTPLDGKEGFSKKYSYVYIDQPIEVTITTDQLDETQQQIPEFNFKYRTDDDNRTKLISVDTPLLNTGATDFSGCFSGCTALVGLPEYLFAKNTQVTNFSGCFSGCTALKSIPEGVFAKNEQVENFSDCFSGCTALVELPNQLFGASNSITKFMNCFRDCTALVELPNQLFGSNTVLNSVSFASCFQNCVSLQAIPDNLLRRFKNIKSLASCFASCTALKSVPENLFFNSTKNASFKECFRDCYNLVLNKLIFKESDPPGYFNEKANFVSCFLNVGSNLKPGEGGEAPELWKNKNVKNNSGCFKNVLNVTNRSDIPREWGGSN